MKRSLWVALLLGSASMPALAQDAAQPAPPASDNPPPVADPAPRATDVTPPGVDPAAPPEAKLSPEIGTDDATPRAEKPATDAAASGPPPRRRGPAGDSDAIRPGRSLEGAEPAQPGLPGSPAPVTPRPGARGARGGAGPSREALPDTILDATPVPENDVPPADRAAPLGINAREADGQGAPLVDEGTIPAPAGMRRQPIERRPLPPDAELSEPLPPNGDVVPPPVRRRPVIDPAYAPPAPPRPQPQIPIGDVVANPVRVYEARLLVLMGHWPAATDAVETLSRRFPTDARVPYLRFFMLSRTNQRPAALDALRQAIAMERLYPVTDYNRFMEPLQGADRYYAERVRRAAAELAAADGLVEPNPDEVLPESARNASARPAPAPAQRTFIPADSAPDATTLPRDTAPVEPPLGTEPAPGTAPVPETVPPVDTPAPDATEPLPGTEPPPGTPAAPAQPGTAPPDV